METSCETLYKPLFPLVTFLSGKEVQAGEKSCPAAFRSHARLWLCLAGRGAEMVDIHPDTPDELIRRFSDDRHKFLHLRRKLLYGLMGASQGQARSKPLTTFGEPPPVGTTRQDYSLSGSRYA